MAEDFPSGLKVRIKDLRKLFATTLKEKGNPKK